MPVSMAGNDERSSKKAKSVSLSKNSEEGEGESSPSQKQLPQKLSDEYSSSEVKGSNGLQEEEDDYEGDEEDGDRGEEFEEDDREAAEKQTIDNNEVAEEDDEEEDEGEKEDERESEEQVKIVQKDDSVIDEDKYSDSSSNSRPRQGEIEEEEAPFVNQVSEKNKSLPFSNDDVEYTASFSKKKKRNKKKKKKRSHVLSQHDDEQRNRKRKAKSKANEEDEEVRSKKACVFNNRLWSEEDELLLLQVMANYRSTTGLQPCLGKTSSFIEDCFSANAVINSNFTKDQIFNKIRTCRRKFLNHLKSKKNPSFRTPNQKKVLHLLNKIWGENEEEDKDKKKKQKQILQSSSSTYPSSSKMKVGKGKAVAYVAGNDDGVSSSILEHWFSEGIRNVECPQQRQTLQYRWYKYKGQLAEARYKLLQVATSVSEASYLAQKPSGGGGKN